MEEKKNILNKIKTELTITFNTKSDAQIIYNSILPEVSFSKNERSLTNMNLINNELTIFISSTDVASLRASINSYVRWINLSIKILKI